MSPVGVPLTNLFMCIVVELGTNLPDTAGDRICELQVHPVPSCEGRLQQGLKTEGIACVMTWFHHEIPSVPGEVLTIELPVDLGPPLRPHPAGEVGVDLVTWCSFTSVTFYNVFQMDGVKHHKQVAPHEPAVSDIAVKGTGQSEMEIGQECRRVTQNGCIQKTVPLVGFRLIEVPGVFRPSDQPLELNIADPGKGVWATCAQEEMPHSRCIVAHHQRELNVSTPPERFTAVTDLEFIIVSTDRRVSDICCPERVGSKPEGAVDDVTDPFGNIKRIVVSVSRDETGSYEIPVLLPADVGPEIDRPKFLCDVEAALHFGIDPFPVPGGCVVVTRRMSGVGGRCEDRFIQTELQRIGAVDDPFQIEIQLLITQMAVPPVPVRFCTLQIGFIGAHPDRAADHCRV